MYCIFLFHHFEGICIRNKLIIKCTKCWFNFQVLRFVYITFSQQKYVVNNKVTLLLCVQGGLIDSA